MAVRVTSDDDVLDSPPLLLASHRVNSEFHAATNGSEFLITWTEGSDWWQFPSPGMRDIYGVRVMSNGAVDAAPIAIATGPENQFRGAVSSDGRDFLVAYGMSGEDGIPNVAVKRVLREGTTVDGAVVGRGWQPSIVRDGNGYLVTSIVNEGVLLTRLDANGARRDATTIQATGVTAAAAVRAGNSLQLVYARLVDDQRFAAAQRVVIRIGEGARVRSVRH